MDTNSPDQKHKPHETLGRLQPIQEDHLKPDGIRPVPPGHVKALSNPGREPEAVLPQRSSSDDLDGSEKWFWFGIGGALLIGWLLFMYLTWPPYYDGSCGDGRATARRPFTPSHHTVILL